MPQQPAGAPSPFDEMMGTRVTVAEPDRTVVTLPVTSRLHQPGGIVHGGVYCALVELAGSVGANAWLGDGRVAVGVSNQTDFLRPVRDGTLRAEGAPLQRGRTQQLWEVRVTDERERLIAHGRLRVANVDIADERRADGERPPA